jgi:hypothetical protein
MWTTSHRTATHHGPKKGKAGNSGEAHANLGLVAAPDVPKVLWFEANAKLAALYLLAPSIDGYGEQ